MATCTSFSNTFSCKIPLDQWNQTAEGERVFWPVATLTNDNRLMINWMIDIYPKGINGYEKDDTRYVDVELRLLDLPPGLDQFQIEAAYRFRHRDCDWPMDMPNSRSYSRFHSSMYEKRLMWFEDSYEVGTVEDRAVDGILIVDLELRTFSSSKMKLKYSRSNDEIVKNFLNIDPGDGDVKFISEGREIPCHKFLLMTQSPVFKAMFEMNSMEKETNTVKIVDCTPDVVEEFVMYLYRGKLVSQAKPLELMFGLLNLAEKYQIKLLIDECVDVLMDIMDVNNVLKIYAVVDKLDLGSDVTNMIIDFMKDNIEVIVDKEDWSPFLSDFPSLMKDFVLNMSEALKQAKDFNGGNV